MNCPILPHVSIIWISWESYMAHVTDIPGLQIWEPCTTSRLLMAIFDHTGLSLPFYHQPLQIHSGGLHFCEGAGSWFSAAARGVLFRQASSSHCAGATQGFPCCRTATLCHWSHAVLGKGHLYLPQRIAVDNWTLQGGMVKVLYYSEMCLSGWEIEVVILDLHTLFAEYFSASLLILHFWWACTF